MDRLEQYLDQVCRCIGGPRALRQHVRQELREHLLDAMAQHKAAGLPEEAALDKALEEFGKPEDVHSELVATHGQRLMAVVLDKAMQWKERTMRAKWLWTTWAYLALAVVIVLQVLFITFNNIFTVPKFQKLLYDGMIDPAILEENRGSAWMLNYLRELSYVCGHYTTFLLLLAIVAIALFEWRVKTENKPFIRLSALGTVGVLLTVVAGIMAGSMVICFELGMPALGRMTRPWAMEQVASLDTALTGLEQALAKKDWADMDRQAEQAATALNRLAAGPALTSLTAWSDRPNLASLRADVKTAREAVQEAQSAIAAKEAARVETALQTMRKMYEPVREAAKRPVQ